MSSAGNKKSVLMNNSVLRVAESKIENNLTGATKAAYQKIVVAGMKAAQKDGAQSLLAQLRQSKDPVTDAGKGAASLMFVLRKNSRDTMPINAMVPAGATLMLVALDFLDKTGTIKIGKPEITTASKAYTDTIFKGLGVSPQMLIKGHESVDKVTKDPTAMEMMRRKAGLVKAPGTSSPTEVPDAENMAATENDNAV